MFTCKPRALFPPQRLICNIHVLFICHKINGVNNLINQTITAGPKRVETRGAPAAAQAGYAGCLRRYNNPRLTRSKSRANLAWRRKVIHNLISGVKGNVFPSGPVRPVQSQEKEKKRKHRSLRISKCANVASPARTRISRSVMLLPS